MLHDVVAVDSQGESLAHQGIVEGLLGVVEAGVVAAQIVAGDHGAVSQQRGHLIRGRILHVVQVAVLERGELGVGIVHQLEGQLLQGDARGVIVVLVGHHDDLGVVGPGGHLERAVGHIGAGILGPGGVALHDVLTQRHAVGERADVQEVRAVVGQSDLKGVLVGSGDAQLLLGQLAGDDLVGVLYHGDNGVVGRGGGGIHQAAPGVHEVVGGHGLAVRPLGILTHLEGVGIGTVLIRSDSGLLGGHAGLQHGGSTVAPVAGGIAVHPLVEALKQVGNHNVAVHSTVHAGIHGLGLGREAHVQLVRSTGGAGLHGSAPLGSRGGLGISGAAAGQQGHGQRSGQAQSKDSALLHSLCTSNQL